MTRPADHGAVPARGGEQEFVDEATTDRLLSDRARAVRSQVRAVVHDQVAPRAASCDTTGAFAGESYQALARAGLAGLLFPADLGGTADDALTYAAAVEEIAAACAATSLIYMTQMHAGYPILLAGTQEQQRTWIPRLCADAAYGSLAITEPDAGSDVSSIRTTAVRDGDGYLVSGAKTFITTGDIADVIILFATVDPSAGRRGVTAFVLPGTAEGLSRGQPLKKMGMHGSSTAELFLDRVRLPASARLGADGEGWRISMGSVNKSRISAAAQGVGIGRAAYQVAVRVLHERGPVPQDVAFTLAEMRARVLAARSLLYATASAVAAGTGEDLTADVSAMKLFCTDLGVDLADQACDLLGSLGDRQAMGAERLLRDAKVTQIYDGTNEIQRLIISRDVARRAGALPGGQAVVR